MRTTKIITITLLLATLFVGCKKGNNGPIRIVSESFRAVNNSKVLIDPDIIQDASAQHGAYWVEDELINLNGVTCTVAYDNVNDFYYLTSTADPTGVQPLTVNMRAIYPGGSFGGNIIELDDPDAPGEITITKLVINKMGSRQEVVFPMVAEAGASELKLPFRHTTGGFRITLSNSGSNINLASIKIVARGEDLADVEPLDDYSLLTRWKNQGPTVPTGSIGGGNDYEIMYSTEMNFDCTTDGTPGITIDAGDDFYLCVPITMKRIRWLYITGYSSTGAELFSVNKDLGGCVDVEANRMYTVPVIDIH